MENTITPFDLNLDTEIPSNAIILSEQQLAAAEALEKWLKEFQAGKALRKFFVLEGFAGTGKSFTAAEIIKRLNMRPAYMTYTGKAAMVLRNYTGVNATTIHSKIYKLVTVNDEEFKALYAKRDETEDPKVREECALQISKLMEPTFELNEEAFTESRQNIIVLDECSMVDGVILADLESYKLPIVALGDPGQLPPVKGEGALFTGLPDARLTEIRRQALDNPIIQWSTWAREKRTLPKTDIGKVVPEPVAKALVGFVRNTPWVMEAMLTKHDVAICWKNATRQWLNKFYRNKVNGCGDTDPVYPIAGDKILFTRNDKQHGIFNGMFAEVLEVGELQDVAFEMTVKLDSDELAAKDPKTLEFLRADFECYADPDVLKRLQPWDFRGRQRADFGYALTCHKAQGSQWSRVLVFEEDCFNWGSKPGARDLRAQWLYTAITRAVDKVTIIGGKM